MQGRYGKLFKLTEEERAILNASPTDELDQAKIKWPKPKKWKLPRGRTQGKRKTRRPSASKYRRVLCDAGRNLELCEDCKRRPIQTDIHHIDGNPWNNKPKNLKVLCRSCHEKIHGIDDYGIKTEWYDIPKAEL